MTEQHPAAVTTHRMFESLFTLWCNGSAAERAVLAEVGPPGPIALRCRYRHLIDTARRDVSTEPVDFDHWQRSIVAETFVDEAIVGGRYDRAAEVCRLLLEQDGFDAVTRVNARIGLGDVHRVRGEAEPAIDAYEAALTAADAAGYRFGRLRALVPLGHLTLAHHSEVRATAVFGEAENLAEELGDPVYRANAMQGLAECADHAKRPVDAIALLERAHAVYAGVRSPTGRAHTAQRLGALHHRVGRIDLARDWLVEAARAFEEDHDPVGVINVLDSLGDILLDVGDVDMAEVQYLAARDIAVQHELGPARAHAVQNLGRVARARARWDEAARLFEQAARFYRDSGDLLGVCTALTRLAESRDRLDLPVDALRARVDAVFAVEEYRAANRDAPAQIQYRARFGDVYATALRSAVASRDAEAFAVVADGLAGRRLAGLAEAAIPPGVLDNLTLLQHVLTSADQRWAVTRNRPGLPMPEGISRQERVRRFLGAAAIRGALPEPTEGAADDLLAAVYLPPANDGDQLLAALPKQCHALQLVRDPGDLAMLHRMWRDTTGTVHLDTIQLSLPCQVVVELLQGDSDRRADLRPRELAPLREILPEGLRQTLRSDDSTRLLLIPVGELWLVPWGAIPLDDRTALGVAAEYVVCPSLSLQRVLRRRDRPKVGDGPVPFWRNPVMAGLTLDGIERQPGRLTPLARATDSKERLGDGTHTVVIVCHGRPLAGPGHFLEMDTGVWLLPADILGPTPPLRLYLITCWGAGVPGRSMTDPVSIATLALARGSVEVLATVGKFGDTPGGNMFAEYVLDTLLGTDVPGSTAVHRAARKYMAEPAAMGLPLCDWALLLPIGTFLD